MTRKINIALLGSTGSIGRQTLEVIGSYPEHFEVSVLTSNNNARLLVEQARQFKPDAVVIAEKEHYPFVRDNLADLPIKIFSGEESLSQVVGNSSIDTVLTALVGFAGLRPTLAAINAGKHIALANKETLVVAGEIITQLAKEKGVNIYPVDSEHSAIFQCMAGEWHNAIEKIYLTASGGPFRGKDKLFLDSVTPEQALKHPNWNMGAKITIDSATLMNKGLEMIEARWLFNLRPEQIEVVVHPQSIIHSMVQFRDGSIKAQMGLPDMKLPILYALSYPQRLETNFTRFKFIDFPSFTFEPPDLSTFTCLALAMQAMEKGGNQPCIMNAANEIAVQAFLKKKISFTGIGSLVETCMNEISFHENPGIEDLIACDISARSLATALLEEKKFLQPVQS